MGVQETGSDEDLRTKNNKYRRMDSELTDDDLEVVQYKHELRSMSMRMSSPSEHHHRSSGSRDRRLAARITKELAAAMPEIFTQIQNLNSNGSATSATPNNYDFRNFLSTKPPSYHGEENATILLQWFEEMENIFIHCECPDVKRTKFASSCFKDQVVVWWNALRNDQELDFVIAMHWEELKEAMKKEFCPEHELQRLEAEFWNLKQIGGDNSTYSSRFRELSRIVPHLVTPETRGVQKYICGLPLAFRDAVMSRNPYTIGEAMDLAASLTDSHIRDGALSRKDSKLNLDKTETDSYSNAKAEPKPASYNNNNHIHKRKAYAVNQPNNQPPPNQNQTAPHKKTYLGPHPLCAKCNFHHSPQTPCRLCTQCNLYGHLANTCRVPHIQPGAPNTRVCYHCGDPNHLRNACPQLIHAHQAQSMTTPIYLTHAHQIQAQPPHVLQVPSINSSQPCLTQYYQAPHPQAQAYQAYFAPTHAMQAQPIQAIPSQSTSTAPTHATLHGAPSQVN